MLHACSTVVPHVLLNLTHPLARRRLVDWHLDSAVPIGDHHRAQTAELSVHLARQREMAASTVQ